MTSTSSAANTGLPSNIIAFPMSPPSAEYEPDRQQFEAAYVALCLSWQFAHLDDAGMDRAIEELLRRTPMWRRNHHPGERRRDPRALHVHRLPTDA